MAGSTAAGGIRLNLGSILATGMHSDFEIECGSQSFKTHKAILCCVSPFFKAAIERDTKEHLDNKMIISNELPEVVARFLIFIYTGSYHAQPVSQWSSEGFTPFKDLSDTYKAATKDPNMACMLAVSMYQIADQTFIDDLKMASRRNFLRCFQPVQDSELEARQFWSEDEMTPVAAVIQFAYESTRADDWMLHDPIVHKMLIGLNNRGCVRWGSYQKLLEDVPRLALEIATSQLSTYRMAKKCNVCNKKMRQRLCRCTCGLMDDCEDEECIELRKTRSICDKCQVFGTCG